MLADFMHEHWGDLMDTVMVVGAILGVGIASIRKVAEIETSIDAFTDRNNTDHVEIYDTLKQIAEEKRDTHKHLYSEIANVRDRVARIEGRRKSNGMDQ